jgi:hypothetical protein
MEAPLYNVELESDLIYGAAVGVSSRLLVKGVSFILGNDLAGEGCAKSCNL